MVNSSDVASAWPPELVALYQDSYASMVRTAFVMLGQQTRAEDVVHDAFVNLARRWTSLGNPGGYLRRSVINGAIGQLRRDANALRRGADPPPHGAPDTLVELRDQLLALPPKQRAAIVLRYLCDLDDAEIAESLGCRRVTVRSLVARGLTQLRKEAER